MKLIFKLLATAVSTIFRGGKPSPKMKPAQVKPNKKTQKKSVQPKKTQAPKKKPQSDNFWQDRIESDGNEARQKFYLKHKDRLQNQDRHRQGGHER